MTFRADGDKYLLVEYGEHHSSTSHLRFRVHVLEQHLREAIRAGQVPGILDITPGVRSLHLHFDRPHPSPAPHLIDTLAVTSTARTAPTRPNITQCPSRIVHLPALLGRPPSAVLAQQEVHAGRPPRRPLVPLQHRVHPPQSTASPLWMTSTASSHEGQLPRPRPRRRLPRRPRRHTQSIPRHRPRHHQIQPRPHLDPPRTPSASAVPTSASTAWKARAATNSSAAPSRSGITWKSTPAFPPGKRRGPCASSTSSASTDVTRRRAPRRPRPNFPHGQLRPQASKRPPSASPTTSASSTPSPTKPPPSNTTRSRRLQRRTRALDRRRPDAPRRTHPKLPRDTTETRRHHRRPKAANPSPRPLTASPSSRSPSNPARQVAEGEKLIVLDAMKTEIVVTPHPSPAPSKPSTATLGALVTSGPAPRLHPPRMITPSSSTSLRIRRFTSSAQTTALVLAVILSGG